MVWFAGAYALEKRRRRNADRHAAMAGTVAPPVAHPVLD
jgi:hypothetical protein